MRIVADENIPLLAEFFGSYGSIVTRPGRAITTVDLREADVLLVRSVTTVDSTLLAGTRVGFVGSCTIGTDHVDRDWLERQGIAFAHAPGCNARAVVEYVLGAALTVFGDLDTVRDQVVGIVGQGQVGSALRSQCHALGIATRATDPWVAAADDTLEAVLASDILSLHVPLQREGPFPTHHLLDATRLAQLAPDGLLVNTARGAVVDNQALLRHLGMHPRQQAVLDVWENEPAIDTRLLDSLALGTPHIAGYSWQGKQRGTVMVTRAFQNWLGEAPRAVLPEQAVQTLALGDESGCPVTKAITRAMPITADDAALRDAARTGTVDETFDRLRRDYPLRNEWAFCRIVPSAVIDGKHRRDLAALGFMLD